MTQKRKVGPGGGDFALNPNRFSGGGGGGKSIITGKKSTVSKKPKAQGSVGDDKIYKRELAALNSRWKLPKQPWQINKERMQAKKGESVPHLKEMKAYYKANNALLAESHRRMNPKSGGHSVDNKSRQAKAKQASTK